MKFTSPLFKAQVREALDNPTLQSALHRAKDGFVEKRDRAVAALPEFHAIRRDAVAIKDHTLANLDRYLGQFEKQVEASGGKVHWAESTTDLARIVTEITHSSGGRKVIKGKSMIGEEAELNEALHEGGFEVIETDLGEYIIQLADEPPSHIIAPAIHKTRQQIAQLFKESHTQFNIESNRESIADLVSEARTVLRSHFISADVGITGGNFLVAENGSVVLVTNEGNDDLSATLPKVHIVTSSIEKVVPTLEDATTLLRLLGRSASGQEMSVYTTLFNGPKRREDPDGPDEFHVVLLDNGRSKLLGGEFQEMLRCIRCGACLNHCLVYGSVGGHAYGWVYSGPMGSVLTPLMQGLKETRDLPNASTLCGRCEEICLMSIPIPRMLRAHRTQMHKKGFDPQRQRFALAAWGFVAKRPRLYRLLSRVKATLLARAAGKTGRLSRVPFGKAWTFDRDLPAPQGGSFVSAWNKQGDAS